MSVAILFLAHPDCVELEIITFEQEATQSVAWVEDFHRAEHYLHDRFRDRYPCAKE